MHASFFATLLLAASVVAPALASPLGYVVILLNLAISAKSFVAFAAALTSVPHFPHVTTPATATIKHSNAAQRELLLRVTLGTRAWNWTQASSYSEDQD
jgi:hypothetical protein